MLGGTGRKREFLYTIERNANWHSHMENSMKDPHQLTIELPYGPAIPLLGIYPKELRADT